MFGEVLELLQDSFLSVLICNVGMIMLTSAHFWTKPETIFKALTKGLHTWLVALFKDDNINIFKTTSHVLK